MIGPLVVAVMFKFAVGTCVLDPGQNKYLILAQNKQADAYVLRSVERPDIVGMMKRAVVDSQGTKTSCE